MDMCSSVKTWKTQPPLPAEERGWQQAVLQTLRGSSIAHFHFGIDCEFLLFELPSLWGSILETLEN